jgi:hypothetical protein
MGDRTHATCKIKDGQVASEYPATPPNPPKGNIEETRAPINEGVLDQTFTSEDDNDNTVDLSNLEIGTRSENASQELSSSSLEHWNHSNPLILQKREMVKSNMFLLNVQYGVQSHQTVP